MGRNGDSAPVGYTCKTIDSVIGHLEEAKSEAEYYLAESENEDFRSSCAEIKVNLESAILAMEKIRSDNSELRDWGNSEFNRAEELEKERDDLLSEVEELKEQMKGMHDDIIDLEDEVSDLEERVKILEGDIVSLEDEVTELLTEVNKD